MMRFEYDDRGYRTRVMGFDAFGSPRIREKAEFQASFLRSRSG
jgi:hypothetical protein